MQALASAEPDGYTIVATSDSTMAVNPWLYEKLPYQPLRDFTPVGTHGALSRPARGAIPSVPARNITELIALAKAKPGAAHLCVRRHRQFQPSGGLSCSALATGVKLLHVPYRGIGPARWR